MHLSLFDKKKRKEKEKEKNKNKNKKKDNVHLPAIRIILIIHDRFIASLINTHCRGIKGSALSA
jgi:hypothetical protein